ncbi:DedA family protein, partial [Salmonella enterica subsp. enterica serovar Cerro]|nr:DedA family protein [Salmonella enterica subsp. enterica serovar Cerro]
QMINDMGIQVMEEAPDADDLLLAENTTSTDEDADFSNPNSKIFRRSYLDKTHQFYEKHGGKTIILARFVPIVRTFAPFVAGMGHMSYRHFAAYNVIGALLWVLLFTYAGYFFGTIPLIQDNLKLLIVGIIVVSILPGVIEIVRHKRAASRAAK